MVEPAPRRRCGGVVGQFEPATVVHASDAGGDGAADRGVATVPNAGSDTPGGHRRCAGVDDPRALVRHGVNRLEWRYRKDPSTFAGMDAAFIDNLFLPEVPVIEPEPETKPTLAVVGIAAEGLRLSVTGDAATEYELQFSTDLKSWSTLANVITGDTGQAAFTDAASAETLAKETWAEAAGFYRAVLVVGDGEE